MSKTMKIILFSTLGVLLIVGALTFVVFNDVQKGTYTSVGASLGGILPFSKSEKTQETPPTDEGIVYETNEDIPNNNEDAETPKENNIPNQKTEDDLNKRKQDNLEVHILDTEGDVILLREGNRTALINTGKATDGEKIQSYLKGLGISRLRYVVGTNYHETSIGGYTASLGYAPSDFYILSPNNMEHDNGKSIQGALDARGLVWTEFGWKGTHKLEKAYFDFIETHADGSLILVVTNGDTKMVFTGTTTVIKDKAITFLPTDVDVYGVNVSKDNYKSPPGVMEKLNPNIAIVADKGGKNKDITKTVKRGFKENETSVYSTSTCGVVVISSNGDDVVLDCNKAD